MFKVLNNVDRVPSNVQFSHQEALLYVFDEAVINMIIKGRSPTMRHVSRTHRVALDWLFDRFNLDSKIQIKYTEQEILTIQNLRQVEDCAFMEVIHLFRQLEVQETNFIFAQFNRIKNHLFGNGIEVGWFACS